MESYIECFMNLNYEFAVIEYLIIISITSSKWHIPKIIEKYIVCPEQRCSLPPIKNGVVVCKQESVQAEMCHIACQKSHIVNPVSIFSRAFDCRDGGEDYLKISSLLKKQEACLCMSSAFYFFSMNFLLNV